MKDLAKENYGDLVELQKLGKTKKNEYTVEQLLDPKLKNIYGESNKEVRERMTNCINEILEKNSTKRIAIVSHGAAIKFFLQNWCKYVYEEDALYFNGTFVCPRKLESPSVLKLEFKMNELINIKQVEC